MIDPTLTMAAFSALEASINRALRYDPASLQTLASWQGKILAVQASQPELTAFVLFTDEGVQLQSQWDGPVTTQLQGKLIDIARLANHDGGNLADSGVTVMGSTALLSDLQQLLSKLDIDWEEWLSEYLGDIVGPNVASSLRAGWQWLQQRRSTSERLLGEFLSEELKATPASAELHQFSQQVDSVRADADRVAARMDAIRQQLQRTLKPQAPSTTADNNSPSSPPTSKDSPE